MRLTSLGIFALALVVAGSTAATAAGESDLISAIKQRETAHVRTLVQQHADVNAKDLDGTTALHWAIRRDEADVVSLLLNGGANATALNRYGISPILVAAEIGNVEVIDKLLRA